MSKLIYWLRKSLRGNNKKCKCFCVTCPYFARCRRDGNLG